MADARFWIWLQEALGIGNPKADRVLRELGSPEGLFPMSAEELRRTGLFAPKEITALKATGLAHAEKNLRLAKRYGCEVLTPEHPDYPVNLTNIHGIPCVLYVLGSLAGLDKVPVLSIVGTRTSTPYGERCAEWLAHDLAAAGCVIASGLAVGIDYASHEGALQAGGRTVGFLACGMNVGYPAASGSLKRRILDCGGALVTEFPFGTPPMRYHFNIRNRILAGISAGVVVVQAPAQSGALNTARHALEQNRDVFAVPGELSDAKMSGCNKLISEGAKLVLSAGSILEEYVQKFPGKLNMEVVSTLFAREPQVENRPRKVSKFPAQEQPLMVAQEPLSLRKQPDLAELRALALSDAAMEVCCVLTTAPVGCDFLAARTGLETTAILAALTELELCDLAEALPGSTYRLKR